MAYKFPTDPTDGQQVLVPSGNGYVVYQYDIQTNTWLIIDNTEIEIGSGSVNTEMVLTVPLNPFATPIVVDAIDDIINLENQREINWTIADLALNAQESQAIQNERISANELATQDLYSITDNHNTRISANSALSLSNKNDIIELEEEIEALAPSLERGSWNYNPLGSAGAGQYSLYNQTGNISSEFNEVATIFINTVDASGTVHGFNDVPIGSYLEVFESDSADFGLYQITDVDDQTSGQQPFWTFTVDFVKSNSTSSEASGLARFKIFELADASDPTAFVLKAGDDMTGPLNLEDENDGAEYTLGGNQAYLKFTTKNSLGSERTAAIFQTGFSNNLKTTNSFFSGGSFYTSDAYFGGTVGANGFASHPSYVRLNPTNGEIRYNQQNLLVWDEKGVTFPNPNTSGDANGFSIEGKMVDDYNDILNPTDGRLFYVSHYSNEGDGIFYNGRITYETHIATKKYVDDNVRPIQIVEGSPPDAQVGDAWFSTNQNTFIIKVS